jgi:hypothetical protein
VQPGTVPQVDDDKTLHPPGIGVQVWSQTHPGLLPDVQLA